MNAARIVAMTRCFREGEGGIGKKGKEGRRRAAALSWRMAGGVGATEVDMSADVGKVCEPR
jgi:hypothetical protein